MAQANDLNPEGASSPLRILFVVPYVPNLIRVRPYNLLRGLHAAGHQVTLLTMCGNEAELAEARGLSAYCSEVIPIPVSRLRSLWNCLAALPSQTPLQAVYSWQKEGAIALDRLIHEGRFDIAHVEHLRGARYALRAQESRKPSVPVVWDSVDSISYLFRQASRQSKGLLGRWITRLELGRTERLEGRLSREFSRVLVTSAKDKSALLELQDRFPAPHGGAGGQAAHIQVLPNGVDLQYFAPTAMSARRDDTLVVSGKMSYHANVTMVLHLVREVMPLIWAQRPDAGLIVAGKDPAREILSLADHPNITVTGSVPDLRPYLQEAAIALAPLQYGAGVQNKVLEAMACATPTITSSLAAEALGAKWGEQLLVEDEPGAFAEATLRLLNDAPRRQQLGQAGRDYVEQHHHWEKIVRQLEGVYREAKSAVPGVSEAS